MKQNQYKLILEPQGIDRKVISKVIGDFFGIEPRYAGVPSFNYEIKTQKGEIFIVEKSGSVLTPAYETDAVGEAVELYSKILEAGVERIRLEVKVSMEGHSGISLRNLINIIASKQQLIIKAFGLHENIMKQELIEGINNVRIVEVEDFKNAFLEIGEEKCRGLNFDFEEDTIGFTYVNNKAEPQKLLAYIQLTQALNNNAKTLKHSSPKETKTDNEKYTFRTWLLRLGFIGDRYKDARNQLLRNLGGNSAFRSKAI